MNKKILIPTDFSKNAWNAVTYASTFFKNQDCTFYILNAYSATTYSTSEMMAAEPGTLTYESATEKSEEGLARVMDMLRFRDANPRHSYIVISEFNNLIDAIKRVVEKRDIDLVIMGTKGASDFENIIFGSNTMLAMEQLRNCPMMGVPLHARDGQVNEIVFPTSYRTHYKRRELNHLVEIAQMHKATICVLHVSKKEELDEEQLENKQLLEECLAGTVFTFHHVGGSSVPVGVQHFIESRDSDMVSFINKKHSFFTGLFANNLVKELSLFSKVPVLVLHDLRN